MHDSWFKYHHLLYVVPGVVLVVLVQGHGRLGSCRASGEHTRARNRYQEKAQDSNRTTTIHTSPNLFRENVIPRIMTDRLHSIRKIVSSPFRPGYRCGYFTPPLINGSHLMVDSPIRKFLSKIMSCLRFALNSQDSCMNLAYSVTCKNQARFRSKIRQESCI